MEGTERIILLQPSLSKQDEVGQQNDVYKEIKVYARRQDRGGREGTYSDTRGGQWQVRFEIRNTPSLFNISEEWGLIDTYKHEYNLEGISFAPFWGGKKILYLYAIRTTSRGKKYGG